MNTETFVNENGYAVEWKKGTRWNEKTFGWYMECKGCNEPTRVGSEKLGWVLCSTCVSKSLNEFDENGRS
jgi:hypothetical protein